MSRILLLLASLPFAFIATGCQESDANSVQKPLTALAGTEKPLPGETPETLSKLILSGSRGETLNFVVRIGTTSDSSKNGSQKYCGNLQLNLAGLRVKFFKMKNRFFTYTMIF